MKRRCKRQLLAIGTFLCVSNTIRAGKLGAGDNVNSSVDRPKGRLPEFRDREKNLFNTHGNLRHRREANNLSKSIALADGSTNEQYSSTSYIKPGLIYDDQNRHIEPFQQEKLLDEKHLNLLNDDLILKKQDHNNRYQGIPREEMPVDASNHRPVPSQQQHLTNPHHHEIAVLNMETESSDYQDFSYYQPLNLEVIEPNRKLQQIHTTDSVVDMDKDKVVLQRGIEANDNGENLDSDYGMLLLKSRNTNLTDEERLRLIDSVVQAKVKEITNKNRDRDDSPDSTTTSDASKDSSLSMKENEKEITEHESEIKTSPVLSVFSKLAESNGDVAKRPMLPPDGEEENKSYENKQADVFSTLDDIDDERHGENIGETPISSTVLNNVYGKSRAEMREQLLQARIAELDKHKTTANHQSGAEKKDFDSGKTEAYIANEIVAEKGKKKVETTIEGRPDPINKLAEETEEPVSVFSMLIADANKRSPDTIGSDKTMIESKQDKSETTVESSEPSPRGEGTKKQERTFADRWDMLPAMKVPDSMQGEADANQIKQKNYSQEQKKDSIQDLIQLRKDEAAKRIQEKKEETASLQSFEGKAESVSIRVENSSLQRIGNSEVSANNGVTTVNSPETAVTSARDKMKDQLLQARKKSIQQEIDRMVERRKQIKDQLLQARKDEIEKRKEDLKQIKESNIFGRSYLKGSENLDSADKVGRSPHLSNLFDRLIVPDRIKNILAGYRSDTTPAPETSINEPAATVTSSKVDILSQTLSEKNIEEFRNGQDQQLVDVQTSYNQTPLTMIPPIVVNVEVNLPSTIVQSYASQIMPVFSTPNDMQYTGVSRPTHHQSVIDNELFTNHDPYFPPSVLTEDGSNNEDYLEGYYQQYYYLDCGSLESRKKSKKSESERLLKKGKSGSKGKSRGKGKSKSKKGSKSGKYDRYKCKKISIPPPIRPSRPPATRHPIRPPFSHEPTRNPIPSNPTARPTYINRPTMTPITSRPVTIAPTRRPSLMTTSPSAIVPDTLSPAPSKTLKPVTSTVPTNQTTVGPSRAPRPTTFTILPDSNEPTNVATVSPSLTPGNTASPSVSTTVGSVSPVISDAPTPSLSSSPPVSIEPTTITSDVPVTVTQSPSLNVQSGVPGGTDLPTNSTTNLTLAPGNTGPPLSNATIAPQSQSPNETSSPTIEATGSSSSTSPKTSGSSTIIPTLTTRNPTSQTTQTSTLNTISPSSGASQAASSIATSQSSLSLGTEVPTGGTVVPATSVAPTSVSSAISDNPSQLSGGPQATGQSTSVPSVSLSQSTAQVGTLSPTLGSGNPTVSQSGLGGTISPSSLDASAISSQVTIATSDASTGSPGLDGSINPSSVNTSSGTLPPGSQGTGTPTVLTTGVTDTQTGSLATGLIGTSNPSSLETQLGTRNPTSKGSEEVTNPTSQGTTNPTSQGTSNPTSQGSQGTNNPTSQSTNSLTAQSTSVPGSTAVPGSTNTPS